MTDYGEKLCQECNHPVAPELDEKIDAGKTVYCEQCGALLTETNIIKTKPRRNPSRHTTPRHSKKEAFSGGYSRPKHKDKKISSQEESKRSNVALSPNYQQKSSWVKWFESFREFFVTFMKNLKESLGGFSTSLREEMAKVREETQRKDQKSAINYPEPILPKDTAISMMDKQPSQAPIAPNSPKSIQSSPRLKSSNKFRFDPYTGKPLSPQEPKPVPGKRFDPFTGKPLGPIEQEKEILSQPIEVLPVVEVKEKIVKIPPNATPDDKKDSIPLDSHHSVEEKPKKTYDEVFMVLTVEVREMLSQLDFPENEKSSMAKTFIYLTEAQQLKYLTELHSLNSPDYTQLNHLIGTIDTLPLPSEQKKILIDQLDYFTDEKSHEFVSVIEREVKKDIERLKSNQESTINPIELNLEGTKSQPSTNAKQKKRLLSD